jgi:CRP-like cAMP-binding protein
VNDRSILPHVPRLAMLASCSYPHNYPHSHPQNCSAKTNAPPIATIRHSPLFRGILPLDYPAIFSLARVKEFGRGEIIYSEDDVVRQVLLITSGRAKITRLGRRGTRATLRVDVCGDVLGAEGLFSTGLHSITAQASPFCQALAWDGPGFKALAERFPALHQNMFRIISGHIRELEQRICELAPGACPRLGRTPR